MDKGDDVELARSGSEEVGLQTQCSRAGHLQARLKGAEGTTFGKEHTSTRTSEREDAIFAVSAHGGLVHNNHHISCARDAVVVRATVGLKGLPTLTPLKPIFPEKDSERRTVSRIVQFRHCLVGLLRQEIDVILVGLEAGMVTPWPTGKTDNANKDEHSSCQLPAHQSSEECMGLGASLCGEKLASGE